MRCAVWIMALGMMAGAASAESLNEQVQRLYREGKYADAEPTAKKALQLGERTHGPSSSGTFVSLSNLAAFT